MLLKTKFKRNLFIVNLVLAIFVGTLSCENNVKVEDTKDVAEEHNDAKFDNTSKEKDAQFLVNAAEINLDEIQLGLLAQQRSKTKIVIALGKHLEDDHSKSMNELTELAAKKIVTIPQTPTDNAKESYKKLNELMGKDFDNAYCSLLVDGHTKAVAIFEKASNESADADIKSWATSTLAVLRIHLDEAINCQKECQKMK